MVRSAALLLILALAAVVIERAIEGCVSKCYEPEKMRVSRPLVRAEAKFAKAEKLLWGLVSAFRVQVT